VGAAWNAARAVEQFVESPRPSYCDDLRGRAIVGDGRDVVVEGTDAKGSDGACWAGLT
jgi:hypothetical protein